MPRTRRSAAFDLSLAPKWEASHEADAASCTTGSLAFPHALFAPLHYAPGYAYPLIVWLHGRGGDERQLQRIMPLVSMRNYVAAAPRGALLSDADSSERADCGWPQADAALRLAEQRALDCIELARSKFHVNPKRVFLAGFDDGGTMALRLAMGRPERFAGVISLCGPFPTGGAPLGNLIAARRLGLFLAAGRAGRRYAPAQVCEDLRLLHTAGLSVTVREYPCGDQLDPRMLADVNRWIMEQINTPPQNA